MIPLINVIFLLLIFFMLAGNVGRPEHPSIELPMAQYGMQESLRVMMIYIDENHQVRINKDPVPQEGLPEFMAYFKEAYPDAKASIYADRAVGSSMLLWIVEQLEQVGVKDVVIATKGD